MDQQAIGGFAEDQGGAGIAAFQEGFAGINAQAASGVLLAVAFEAVLDQGGADAGFEEGGIDGGRGGSDGNRKDEPGEEKGCHVGCSATESCLAGKTENAVDGSLLNKS